MLLNNKELLIKETLADIITQLTRKSPPGAFM